MIRRYTNRKPAQVSADIAVAAIELSLCHLRVARGLLRAAGAPKAADAVQRTIKSAEGARNHARRRASVEAGQ